MKRQANLAFNNSERLTPAAGDLRSVSDGRRQAAGVKHLLGDFSQHLPQRNRDPRRADPAVGVVAG
jgi:hypothetical protein